MSQITVSYSELDAGRQCAYKHLLAYKERWTTETTSPALAKGTQWHAILEVHYLSLKQTFGQKNRLGVAINAVTKYLRENQEVFEEHFELLWWMYEGYIEMYRDDPNWKILAVEYAAEMPLSDPSGKASPFTLKAKIDLIVSDISRNKIMIVDHKSGKDLPTDKFLELDDQFSLYWAMLREKGHKIFCTIHNASRTHKNKNQDKFPQSLDSRYLRSYMNRTDAELDRVVAEAFWTARDLYARHPEETPRSPNPDTCKWRCGYLEPCMTIRKGVGRATAMSDFGFVQNFERH